ncbi:MAG: hypothetical protein Q9184_008005 [Pyrenodesmia sp. 2 TL-2023]
MNQNLKEVKPSLTASNAPENQDFEDTAQMVQLTVIHGSRDNDKRRSWPDVDLSEGFENFRDCIHRALYCKDIRSINVPTLPEGWKVVSITARWLDGTLMDRVTAMTYAQYVDLRRSQEDEGVPGWLEVELGEEREAVQQEWRDRLRPLRS